MESIRLMYVPQNRRHKLAGCLPQFGDGEAKDPVVEDYVLSGSIAFFVPTRLAPLKYLKYLACRRGLAERLLSASAGVVKVIRVRDCM